MNIPIGQPMSDIHTWIISMDISIDIRIHGNPGYFVVCYFQRKLFNITELLNQVALSVKLVTQM